MNKIRYIYGSIAVFVFIFAFDFIFHGLFLKDIYMQTAQLWRAEGDICMWYAVLKYAVYALVFAYIYTRYHTDNCKSSGLRFGLYIGSLIGIIQMSSYIYMPIPLFLAISWFIGTFIQNIIAGLLLGIIYKQ